MSISKIKKLPMYSLILSLILACSSPSENQAEQSIVPSDAEKLAQFSGRTELATFAGGCFWCVEAPFEDLDGVITVISGYAGGKEKNPTYGEVSSGKTSHRESVQITFDPEVISYSELVDIFWQTFDPTDVGGSFYDRGSQYESAIFYHSAEQKKVAEESKKLLDESGRFSKPIATPVIKYTNFYPAEEYHQDYYKKNPADYYAYRKGSGRDAFIQKHWPELSAKKYPAPSKKELKENLTPLQYEVTMEDATEFAFQNEYNGNKEEGIYVCIVSGAPLFSSKDKYESGSGWPSFTKPIDARFLEKPIDKSLGMTRVEVRSKLGKSHVGHVFYDGPAPTGLRYCMNSAAMKFIPKSEMEAAGYGEYLWLVD
ncbi:MAG: peptide-methionine (S)-S-oxide reductase MsrA [Algoriphagus sp.]|nr:peptide-methionine (S)-S-oxide reductase MsrA [Algoriphagus sp.]